MIQEITEQLSFWRLRFPNNQRKLLAVNWLKRLKTPTHFRHNRLKMKKVAQWTTRKLLIIKR